MRVQPRCVELLRSRCRRRESDRAKANTPRRRHHRLLRRLKGYLTGVAVDCLPRGQDRAVRSRGCVPMSPVPLGDLPGVAGGRHQRVDSRRDVEIAGSVGCLCHQSSRWPAAAAARSRGLVGRGGVHLAAAALADRAAARLDASGRRRVRVARAAAVDISVRRRSS